MSRGNIMTVVSLVLTLAVAGCDTIQVPGFNQDPIANAGPDASVAAGETVTLSAAGSADADGDSLSYIWTKTGGPSLTLQVTNQKELTFVPEFGGTYEFTVTVTDGQGGSDNDTARVSVQGPPDPTMPPNPSPAPNSPSGPTPDSRILVDSTFDLDHEGWSITGNGKRTMPDWEATGGRPSGTIWKKFNVSPPTAYWDAPPKFLGDLSAALGGTLSFDIFINTRSRKTSPLVFLTGSGGSTLELNKPLQPQSGWTAFSIRLDATAGWRDSATGLAATNGDISEVLADVVQLRIRGEYPANSVRPLGKLDNVIVLGP